MKDIIDILKSGDDFFIAAHQNPDGDAIGSSIALSMALESLGKKSTVFDPDGVPDQLRFLPGCERVTSSFDASLAADKILILIDCNMPKRADIENVRFSKSIVIDHHETESDFGDVKWIEPRTPATGLMVFRLLKELGIPLTTDMATNLYAAIAVDTGTFRYSNTTPESLKAAAELLEAGVRPGQIADNLYQRLSTNTFKLLCLNMGSLEITDSVGITSLSEDSFLKTNTTPADTENFVNYPLMVRDINVSVFFREAKKGQWKVSLRSKGELNVARIAQFFGGGGHKNAAGFTIETDLKNAKQRLFETLNKIL